MGTACNGVRLRPKNLGGRQRRRNPVVQGAKDWAPQRMRAWWSGRVQAGEDWQKMGEGSPKSGPGSFPEENIGAGGSAPRGAGYHSPAASLTGRSTLTSVPSSRKTRQ